MVNSNHKGRRGEYEASEEAEAFGLDTKVHGVYEAQDITIEGFPYEVKRCENLSLRRAHDAFKAGNRGLIARINRQPFTITVDYKDWLEDQAELKDLRAKMQEPQYVLTERGMAELYAPIKVRTND